MITNKDDRMLEFLWFVGYCVEFPTQLACRIGGHPEWNRHVMYRAIREGYVDVWRGKHRQRVIRSLRLTSAGMDYVSEGDPKAMTYIMAKQEESPISARSSAEKVLRYHSLATGIVMAHRAGAAILPEDKPSLMTNRHLSQSPAAFGQQTAYFYSTQEIRRSIQEYDPDTVAKGSRIIGIIVSDRYCFCLYHTGHTRMFWMRSTEENTAAAIQTMLEARGFHCEMISQVVIGSKMPVAAKLTRPAINTRSRYFSVSDYYANCFFLVNSALGDDLLSTIINPVKRQKANVEALTGFAPPTTTTREYDAVTKDGLRPVILNFQCDLLALLNMNPAPYGFKQSPILLCYDYQVDVLQAIVGPMIEVRSINGGTQNEEKQTGGHY